MFVGILFQILLWNILIPSGNCYLVDGDPNRHAEFVDPEQKYYLEWMVNRERNRITFNVTVRTHGWILFGLANNAENETGKDVIIGGVLGQSRTTYFSDRHEKGGSGMQATLDRRQNYKLEVGWESSTETFLSFSRNLDTCDSEDYPITENKVTIIWAYGDSDNYDGNRGHDYRKRGSMDVYLLDPETTPRIIRDVNGNPRSIGKTVVPGESQSLKLWSMFTNTTLTGSRTTYLCSIHKAPRMQKKHHVIGFQLHFLNAQSAEHVHHYLFFKCNAPRGYSARALFEPFVNANAETCYFLGKPPSDPSKMPVHFCNEARSGLAIGSREVFISAEAGMPFGEDSEEYYLAQVHYDNPQQTPNVEVSFRTDYWYTPNLRPYDAGFMAVGLDTITLPPTSLVPPKTSYQRVHGHCSGEATRRMLPPEGITVVGALLHSHNSGKAMRLRHFDMKNNVELPWILFDDNYSNQFQKFRTLNNYRKILPGDQLTMECTYDNTWTNSSVVSGFSTNQEMCSAFIVFYRKITDFTQCRSQIVSEEGRKRFLGGLENITWTEREIDWVALSPPNLAGLTVTEISDRQDWSERKREELKRFSLTTPSVGVVSRDLFARSEESLQQALAVRSQLPLVYPPIEVDTEDDFSGLVGYPFEAKPYSPPKEQICSNFKRSRMRMY